MEELLRSANLKVTKGRLEVLRVLSERDVPLNSEEIFSKCDTKVCPHYTSVYRILSSLSEGGIVEVSVSQNGLKYFKLKNKGHKHYIRCMKCGEISPIESCPIEAMEEEIEEKLGYSIIDHNIEFVGVCPKCRRD